MVNIYLLIPLGVLGSYIRTFHDQFENLNNWDIDVMPGKDSGNNEWEYYTSRSENVFISGSSSDRHLTLRALHEEYEGYHYTSGKVHSKSKYGPYGFFNVKAVVPKGNGLWPAIWLLPVPTSQSKYGNWAACGEIDIMETVCTHSAGYATLHFGGPYPQNVQYPTGGRNAYPFHVDWSQPHWYGVEWQPGFMQFWFDAEVSNGVVKGTVINYISSSTWYSKKSDGQHYHAGAPFDEPFNIVLNLAIGGNWPCSIGGCCDNIAAPAELDIYEVEIWEKTNLESS